MAREDRCGRGPPSSSSELEAGPAGPLLRTLAGSALQRHRKNKVILRQTCVFVSIVHLNETLFNSDHSNALLVSAPDVLDCGVRPSPRLGRLSTKPLDIAERGYQSVAFSAKLQQEHLPQKAIFYGTRSIPAPVL